MIYAKHGPIIQKGEISFLDWEGGGVDNVIEFDGWEGDYWFSVTNYKKTVPNVPIKKGCKTLVENEPSLTKKIVKNVLPQGGVNFGQRTSNYCQR